jgi:hypothetical protein
MKLENQMDLISKRLIEIGFKKQIFNKPEEDKFKATNEIDFICELSNTLKNSKDAKVFSDEFSHMILNDFVPEVSFIEKDFELEFYLKKNLIKITTAVKDKEKTKECGFTVSEVLPFKEITIDNFFKLFIEKEYNIELILNSGSN